MGGRKIIVNIGQVFGRLTVEREVGRDETNRRCFACRCECGNVVVRNGPSLRASEIPSCGCYKQELSQDRWTTHGAWVKHHRLYGVWMGMRARCGDPRHRAYSHYGARGIRVCEKWSDFGVFLADMGDPGPGFQIDRINNDGNYEPDNCRWVSRSVNMRNTRANRRVSYMGEMRCIGEWAERLGMSHNILYKRIVAYGWSVERAMTQPVLRRSKKIVPDEARGGDGQTLD